MPTFDVAALLGLAGLIAGIALLLPRSGRAPRLLTWVAAVVFGMAMGVRAAAGDAPVPGACRFVALASFGSMAFHQACCWLHQKLLASPNSPQ